MGQNHHHIGVMVVQFGPEDADYDRGIVVRQGRIRGLAADDPRKVLAELHRLDVLGTRAFWSPAFRIGHLLAFLQFVETDALEA